MVAMTTPEAPQKDQVRILVVDDHPNTAATLARALTQLGPIVDVISATSGHDALEKVKTVGVDILFTDMIMPEMTGLELIEKMQHHPAGRPSFTYLVTAYDVPGLKVTAQRLKVNEVIVKPVRPERIFQIATNAIEEMKHSTKPTKAAATTRKKFKILVADDRPDNVTLLARYLEYEGYEYVIARDGLEALDKVRDELPDLVLLDVNMPHKDGFIVLEEIRGDPAVQHIPVIILTAARLDPADVQSGLNLGADDYVTKPFDRHELMARIRTKLRVKETEDIIRRRNRELNLLPQIGKELSARVDIKDVANILLKRTVETLGAAQGNMVIFATADEAQQNFEVSISPEPSKTEEVTLCENLLKHITESREGLVVEDAQDSPFWKPQPNSNIRSALIAPLNGRKELLGVLTLTHEQEKYFNFDHLLLLQAIASQAAIAAENARLYSRVAQEQKRLAALLKHAAEAILMFDAQGRLTLLNPAGEKLFTDFKANLNQPLPAGHGYDAFVKMLDDARLSNISKSGEVVWPDQRTFVALITPIENGGQVSILHDVTCFKDLEQVKNEFIATASHDLKNPITTIAGFSTLLAQAGPLNEQQQDFVNRIQFAAQNMSELVQNMMSLAQMDLQATQKHEPLEMGALLADIVDEFFPQAEAKDQTLQFDPLTTPVQVNGDPLQLKQLFRNLIGNAIKYSPEGGRIIVVVKAEKENIQVDVQDTGYGIPAAGLPFIFDRFYRVRSGKVSEIEGNGLGLAIVKSIVEQHGGRISVESEMEKGTCFSVSLPLTQGETSSILHSKVRPSQGLENKQGE
jgi:signal transduction histidine kinase/DNA-binding response OmpR family regulator